MAAAKQRVGAATVTRRQEYTAPRARREPPALVKGGAKAFRTAQAGAREIAAIFYDQIVYATLDTLHLMRALEYAWRGGRRNRVRHVTLPESAYGHEADLAVEPVSVWSIERGA